MDWSQMTLDKYLEIGKKRLWVIVLCFLVTMGSTGIYNIRQKPVYQAIATISVGPDYFQKLPLDQFLAYDSESLFLQTQLHVLKSKAIAEGIARTLKLGASAQSPSAGTQGSDGVDWVSFVRSALIIERQADSRIFFIKARAQDPVLARNIANAAVRVYSDLSVERVIEASRKSISWLTEQLMDLKKKVEDSEMALIKYIEEENLTSSADAPSIQGGVTSQPYSLGEDRTLQELNMDLVKTELDLEKLRSRFGSKYPSVARLRSEIALVQAKLDAEKRKIIEGNKKKIHYSILRRDAELNKELYNLFMTELKETNVIAEMGMSNVTVINEAELPTAPVSPRKKFNLLLGALIGLFLGFGAAFAQEQLDRTLKTEEDVRHHLNLPILAYIPKIKSDKKSGTPFLIHEDPRSSSSEAFRILRTNVKFSSPQGEGKVLLVTSGGPLEGKTTILSNLGNAMAQAGERVILVDTDLRRPRLHEVFGLQKEPGMTNLLVEEGVSLHEQIRPSGNKGLDILTSGPISPNPAELLESGRMKEMIGKLRKSYDRILFDSPPLGLVTDAAILAALVDGVIYVVQVGVLDRSLHQQAKSQLDKARARIYGVVLNNMKAERKNYYHYQYYYTEGDIPASRTPVDGGRSSPAERPGSANNI